MRLCARKEKIMSNSTDEDYYKWLSDKYSELHDIEIQTINRRRNYVEYLGVLKDHNLSHKIRELIPYKKPTHTDYKSDSVENLEDLLEMTVPVRYSVCEKRALYVKKIELAYNRFDKMAKDKNILILNDYQKNIKGVLGWFSKFHDLNENLSYLVAILLCAMKNNRDEYKDNIYSPEPFNDEQKTDDDDITFFRSMIVLDENNN